VVGHRRPQLYHHGHAVISMSQEVRKLAELAKEVYKLGGLPVPALVYEDGEPRTLTVQGEFTSISTAESSSEPVTLDQLSDNRYETMAEYLKLRPLSRRSTARPRKNVHAGDPDNIK